MLYCATTLFSSSTAFVNLYMTNSPSSAVMVARTSESVSVSSGLSPPDAVTLPYPLALNFAVALTAPSGITKLISAKLVSETSAPVISQPSKE